MLELNAEINFDIDLNNYPQSWYPICTSDSLKSGKILIQQAFGRDWVLFRNQKNQIAMLPRHCQHMGADLANGKIINGKLECPLHHWRYDIAGPCSNLDEQIPQPLSALPTTEKYGLIFAFLGKQPLFAPLEFEHLKFPVISSSNIIIQTPSVMLALNTFDISHYLTVHNRKLIDIPNIYSNDCFHLGILYNADVVPINRYDKLLYQFGRKQITNRIDCWGGNTFLISNKGTAVYSIVAALPINSHKTKIFIIGACEKSSAFWRRISVDLIKCYLARLFTMQFLKPDFPALENMQPKFNHSSIKKDAALVKFFTHWQALPKINLI